MGDKQYFFPWLPWTDKLKTFLIMFTKPFFQKPAFYNRPVRLMTTALFVVGITLLTACNPTAKNPSNIWVGTWATSPQLVEPHNNPPEPGLTNNTLRQVVRVSIGGDSLKVRFSNEFSNNPVDIVGVQIAVSKGGCVIDSSTVNMLLFGQKPGITIQPGQVVTSDPVLFQLSPRSDIAITLLFGETSPDITGHPGSRTTSFIKAGNHLSDPLFSDSITTDHWYVINGIDVKASENSGAVVVLGNSITDGRGSGTNQQNRWTDILADRLVQNPSAKKVAVLNHGIGGNCVLKSCLGPSAVDRFQSDVLNQSAVKWLVILEGVNDLGQTPDSMAAAKVADDLIVAFEQMINKAHNNGILVYGATILPFGESFYYTSFREAARKTVNEWICNSGKFDAVIDFDKAMQNPENPLTLLPDAHTGDYLHPNEAGYRLMGEFVDLKLFENQLVLEQ